MFGFMIAFASMIAHALCRCARNTGWPVNIFLVFHGEYDDL